MRRLLLLLAITPLYAQQQQNMPIRRPQGPSGSISGHILCADTNAPARLARVSLMRLNDSNSAGGFVGGGGGASTDFDGAYTVTGVQPGTYTLRVQFDGYVDQVSMLGAVTDPQQIKSLVPTATITGTETVGIDLRIERGSGLSGQVLYDDGSPASGLPIIIRDAPTAQSGTRTGAVGRMLSGARTDDRGNFRLTSIPPGEYVVFAMVNIPTPVLQAANFNFRPQQINESVYAPGTYHAKAAKTYKVGHAEEIGGVSITVPTRGMHAITGTVVQQANGMPVGGGNVQLSDADDPAFHLNGQIAPDGSYRIDYAPPGSYTLRVSSAFDRPAENNNQGPSSMHYYGTTQVALTVTQSDVSGVTLQVPVLDDPSRPPQGARAQRGNARF